jgi:hypothetical protein
VTTHRIFVIQPFDAHDGAYELIVSAAGTVGASVARLDSYNYIGDPAQTVQAAIQTASLIIADVSTPNANVMYEVGFAHANNKPVLLVTRSGHSIPIDVASLGAVVYDETDPAESIKRLAAAIRAALSNPDRFLLSYAVAKRQESPNVFVSYCHADREYLNRLLVHLRPLEKAGYIDLWVDTRLRAGDRWKLEIEKALTRATVAVLLISADFLASDFITDNELPPLLRNAEERGTRIIPVILKPCRFTRDDNLRHFQAINDPSRTLALLPSWEQELLYDQVANEVEIWLRRR